MTKNERLATQLACVGAVVCIMLPLGQVVFPIVAGAIGAFPFTMVSATLGLGLFEVLFG